MNNLRRSITSFRRTALLALWVASCVVAAPAPAQDRVGASVADGVTATVADSELRQNEQARRLRDDIEYLASDALRGRGTDDPTIDQAAQYISSRMESIGLDTGSFAGSPLQPFEVVLGARAAGADLNHLTLKPTENDAEPISVALGEGFQPMAIGSSSGRVSGPILFAGYGITAPDLNYDDYEGLDVGGSIVMILRKEPQATDPNSRFQGTRNTQHAFFKTKIENAIKHGASAIILVNDPESVLQAVQNVRSKIFREKQRRESIQQQIDESPANAEAALEKLRVSLQGVDASLAALEKDLAQAQRGILGISEAGRRTEGSPSIPVASVARDLANAWLKQFAGKPLEEIEGKIDRDGSPLSLPLSGIKGVLAVELEPLKAETSNVIGVLPGQGGLAEQTVVIGAHYDHVGMGGEGSLAPGIIAVHNGADDNASGTAALLGAAAQIKAELAGQPSHRRVVFMAFAAEERGLLGSKHYVRNPRFPLESTVAMVNLDMVGRLRDNELTVYGTGSSAMFDPLVEQANAEQPEPFRLFKVASGYGPSDHQSFYEAKIPVIFFFTGLHNDYHRPTDDFDKIDFGGLTRITDIVSDVACELAIRNERPAYVQTDKRVQIRRQLTAFLGVSLSDQGDHVVISAVVSDGPAEQGGIKAGDRLEKLGDQRVQTASEVIEWVRAHSPGEEVKVMVTRGGKEQELTVKLAQR